MFSGVYCLCRFLDCTLRACYMHTALADFKPIALYSRCYRAGSFVSELLSELSDRESAIEKLQAGYNEDRARPETSQLRIEELENQVRRHRTKLFTTQKTIAMRTKYRCDRSSSPT